MGISVDGCLDVRSVLVKKLNAVQVSRIPDADNLSGGPPGGCQSDYAVTDLESELGLTHSHID